MWVMPSNLEKLVPPIRSDVTPYLPTVSRLGILQANAGNRAQSVVKQAGDNTGANGEMIWVKQVLEKCLNPRLQPESQMQTSFPIFSR